MHVLMKKIIYSFLVFILSATAYAGVFTTQYFEVIADVQKDNVVHYTENIGVDLLQPMYGIYRTIPYAGNLYYKANGKVVDDFRHSLIDNVRGNTKVFVEDEVGRDSKFKVIMMGDPDVRTIGPHNYKLTYDYTILSGVTTQYDYDLIYLSLLPVKWKSDIGLFAARVILPKKVDIKNLKLYQGKVGDSKNKINQASIKNLPDGRMVIDVRYANVPRGAALSLFATVPKGYFENVHNFNQEMKYLLIYGAALVFLSAIAWYIYGRDEKVIKTVEFYPPDGIDPMHLAYIYSDFSTNLSDMSSLFVYMANKKYIELTEDNKKLKMVKLVDDLALKDEKEYVQNLFKALFKEKDEIYYSELEKDFWVEFNDIYDRMGLALYQDIEGVRITYKARRILMWPILLYILGIGVILYYMGDQDIEYVGAIVVVMLVYVFVYAYIVGSIVPGSQSIKSIIMGDGIWTLFGLLMTAGIAALAYRGDYGYAGIPLGIFLIIITYFYGYGSSTSKKRAQVMGRILGFRDFLRLVEVDKLKKLVEDDPTYFYDIMPYAYVLGLSSVWIEKIKVFAASNPKFADVDLFIYETEIMNEYIHNASSSMYEKLKEFEVVDFGDDDDYGGGGSGSGGYAGGGFGGGGGGAWG